jgi:hypothetical protein
MDDEQPVEVIVNKVNRCITCGEPSVRICIHCGQEFCSKHFCMTHEFNVESEPLVDDDGATHKGRHLKLIGEGWPHALLLMKDLTDEELDQRITDLQKALKEAIRTADYTQISLAAHEFERDYRGYSRHVAAVKRREKLEKQGQIRLNAKKIKLSPDIPADIAALMKAFGLTQAEAMKMKSVLGKGQV